ncbi:tastin [Alligator sinensis]|uniref:Tastin n=1 Tax=Alligator sinensis TaxID=38654 RepID=A0A1U7S5V1_ALLSI|nr:tastin [Alligator sinensis]
MPHRPYTTTDTSEPRHPRTPNFHRPMGKAPRTQPSPGPAGWRRSRPRAPLEEIQLGAGGQKKVPESSAASKDASVVEFVADPAALAGILSNVRLCSPVLGPGGKPSLARRIPLRGSRGNSLLAQGNTKGSRALSLSTRGSVPPRRDSARGSCLSAAGQEGLEAWAAPSPFGRVPVKKATPGAHPSPFGRVLARKLQSTVCADAPGTHASPSGRVPAMTPLPTGSTASLLGTHEGIPTRGHSARLSCLSTMGQEGLPRVPHTSDVHSSPFSHAPVTQPQSTPNPACAREMGDRHQLHVEQTPGRCGAGQPLQPCSPDVGGSDPREMAQPWEKVAVRRLFEDEDEDSQGDLGGSHSRAPAQVGTPHGISKEQHIQRLLQKAVEGVDGATPLDELHALLAAYPPSCLPVPPCSAPVPGLVLGDRRLDPTARAVPQGGTGGFQGAGTTLTFSSLRPLCASPPIHSLRTPGPPAARTMLAVRPSRLALAKQRLDSLLRAPQRFLDACLDDECAFYTGRAPGTRPLPSRTCPNPVALQLEAKDAAYFVSISPPGPRAPSSAPAVSLPQPAQPPEGDIGAGGPALGLLEDHAPASSSLAV